MSRKSIAVLAFAVVILALFQTGCSTSRDTVRVTDAVSGAPIQGARVVPMYPSFGGSPGYMTDQSGIARIGGFGLPCGGYGVQVCAEGYLTKFIGTYPTEENHAGWIGTHMDVSLQPVAEP